MIKYVTGWHRGFATINKFNTRSLSTYYVLRHCLSHWDEVGEQNPSSGHSMNNNKINSSTSSSPFLRTYCLPSPVLSCLFTHLILKTPS